MHPQLTETLREAQRFGFFGARDIEESIAHAGAFVEAIGPVVPGTRVLDLGSGGGLPGLVLADSFPQAEIVLLDRRQKRTDFLERAVLRLGWNHVTVVNIDASELIESVASGRSSPFDVVTARGFGPPEVTIRVGVALCSPAGLVVVSEPPSGDRWSPGLLDALGVEGERVGSVRRFRLR